MKALKSDLARKVLANDGARTQLRLALSSKPSPSPTLAAGPSPQVLRSIHEETTPRTIVFQDGATMRRLTATIVRKAA